MTRFDGFGPEPVEAPGNPVLADRHRQELAAALTTGRPLTILGLGAGEGLELFAEPGRTVLAIEGDAQQAAATAARAEIPGVAIRAEDPVAWVNGAPAPAPTVLVALDVTRAVAPEAIGALLAGLRRLAASGTPMIVGLPVVAGFAGEPFPDHAWSARAARQALEELGADPAQLVEQLAAEGSVFRGGEFADAPAVAELRWPERADLDFGGHLLALVNLALPSPLPAVLEPAAAPVDGLTIHALRDGRRALHAVNTMLGRDAFARYAAGAASPLVRRDREIAELQAKNDQLQTQVDDLLRELEAYRNPPA